jgi:hypothetical protein
MAATIAMRAMTPAKPANSLFRIVNFMDLLSVAAALFGSLDFVFGLTGHSAIHADNFYGVIDVGET